MSAYPAFGSLSRSKIASKAGAHSQLAGLTAALVVLLASLYILPCLHYLPKPVLSSIIINAATGLLSETKRDAAFIAKIKAWKEMGLVLLALFAVGILELVH